MLIQFYVHKGTHHCLKPKLKSPSPLARFSMKMIHVCFSEHKCETNQTDTKHATFRYVSNKLYVAFDHLEPARQLSDRLGPHFLHDRAHH